MNKEPFIVAISLNYNQNEYTLDCIHSVLKSTYDNFEILLIDNGSTNENFAELESNIPNDNRLILERVVDNLGYVGGVNHGLQMAKDRGADYFLILNNDTLLDAGAMNGLIEAAIKHNDNAIVSGKVYNYDEKDTYQYIGNDFGSGGILDYKTIVKNKREKDIGQYEEEKEMAMLDDIFWMIPAKIFDKIGYYSDNFFLYGEQTDYAIRAKKEGFKLIYTPNAKLWHKGGITTADGDKTSPKILYWITCATLKLSVLHYSESEAKSFYKSWVTRRHLKFIGSLFLGKTTLKHYKAFRCAVRHFKYWNEIRFKDNGYNPF